ncbi:MAG: MFS transporter [Planctomycetota bacterium]
MRRGSFNFRACARFDTPSPLRMSVPDAPPIPTPGPLAIARRAAGSFHPRAMPAPIRRNYARELPGTAMLAVGRAAFEGSIIAGVTRVAYDGVIPDATLNYAVAALATAPAAANILNFVWTRVAHGANKTRFIAAVQIAMIACIVGLALMPATPIGLVGLIAMTFCAWVCWSGFVAVRSTVWRANYARSVRARVAGKLSTVQTIAIGSLGIALGVAMDAAKGGFGPGWLLAGVDPIVIFRVFLISAACVASVGIGILATVRVRQHKRLLVAERESSADNTGPTLNPIGVVSLLLEDRRYGAYQVNQFLMGMGNLMIFPLLPIILRERFEAGYFKVLLLSGALGMLVVPFAVPLWARLLDGVHIVRFRAVHSWVFVALVVLLMVAVFGHIEWLLYAVACLKGVAMGGGMLAWQLGHHDFAPTSRAGEYMGVHVTLTGVRGMIGPVAAVSLYNVLDEIDPSLSPAVLVPCLALVLAGAVGFVLMNLRMDLSPVDERLPADSKTRGPAPVSRADS